MKTLNQLLATPGVRGVTVVEMKTGNRGVSAPRFRIDTDDWPEWAVPHLRELIRGDFTVTLPRLITLANDDEAILRPVLGDMTYGGNDGNAS